jgi:hypothetical protein
MTTNRQTPSRQESKNVKINIYKIIILTVALYGCETSFLTFREEHTLRVFENRMLREIFRPKRDDITGGWRKLHNEKVHSLYSSPNVIRITKLRTMRCAGYVRRMGDKRSAYRILREKPEGQD